MTADWSDEAIDRLRADIDELPEVDADGIVSERIERIPLSVRRYEWSVEWMYSGVGGWTFTRRGAARAIRKAKGSV